MFEEYRLPDAAKASLEKGNRVIVVDDDNVITTLRPNGTVFRLVGDDGNPHRQSSRKAALAIAKGFANLSEDQPFVVGWDDEA